MKMIKNEFKFIFSNRLIRISLFAIMFIPFLYSVFFLRSVWDPYGSTGNLPIAVVNEDKQVTYEGQKMHAGADMVKQLKHNTQLDWHFVSKKQAEQGIKDHKYYTVVTLPKNFSANAATVLDAHPKKMEIKYKTNDSLNYIATVVSDTAAESLNSQVKEAVTTAYTKVVFDQVTVAGKGFKTAATGAQKLNDGSIALSDGLNVYTGGVSQVNDGVMTLKMGVSPLASGVNQLAGGSSTLNNGLQTLNSKTGALSSGASQLSVGANQLNSGLQTLNGKTGTLASGANQLAGGASQLNSGLDGYTKGVSTLNGGLNKLNANSTTLNSGAKQLSEGSTQLQAGSQQLDDGLKKIQSELNAVDYNQSSSETKYMQDKLNALTPLLANLDTTLNGLVKISVAGAKPDAYVDEMVAAMEKAGTPLTDEQKVTVKKVAAQSYKDYGTVVGNNMKTGVETQLNSKISSDDIKRMQADLTATQTLLTKVQTLSQSFNAPLEQKGLVAGMDQLNAGLKQTAAGSATLQAGLQQYTGGVSDATNGSAQLTANNGALTSGSQQLAAGTSQLNSQVPALTSGVSQLAAGSQQLATGTSQLNSQVPALTSGVSQLADGSNILYGGLSQLKAQIPTLSSGVDQLALGTSQLVDNSGALIDGANQLKDGNGTLASGLKSGSDKIGGIKITDKNIKQFVTPAKLSHSKYSSVPNYGYALAPYVLSLALYVGAIVFNFAFPIRKISTTGQSATAWFFSKAIVAAIVAIAMAVIEPVLMMLAGLHAEHPAELFLMTIIFSLASMAIVMFLSMVFDNPGRFVAMLLLMLQLGGSGGTFPMEMTNHFYNVIHPYIPMTYSVLGLRQAMTSGLGMDQIWNSVGVLLAIAVVFTLLTWLGMYFLQKHGKAGKSQLDNNQSLQAVEK
ncbi:YhgE/Pip family protein [Weissella koreensis]|uniref:YhgE/Pip domain-containing protein n=1 Tax=Weissella koreensis TaxID=165096 RepID=A0A7H1ML34_9LACO|nr:YhgE/Pip domain-containing protein [Weissella koreensis]QGN20192.1 YhgE/Pip domain-containing protein [Weissella koreensis]QNT64170.1 YhgE/Pip domain-containing protein [Weissella koreensis]